MEVARTIITIHWTFAQVRHKVRYGSRMGRGGKTEGLRMDNSKRGAVIVKSLGAWLVYLTGAIRHETFVGAYRTKRDAVAAAAAVQP